MPTNPSKLHPEELRNLIYSAAIKDLFSRFSRKEFNAMSNPEQFGASFPGPEAPKVSYRDDAGDGHTVEKILNRPSEDNWINKSSGMRCHTCAFYVPKGSEKGRCRRHAPTLSGWPVMFPTDWCGDHKLA